MNIKKAQKIFLTVGIVAIGVVGGYKLVKANESNSPALTNKAITPSIVSIDTVLPTSSLPTGEPMTQTANNVTNIQKVSPDGKSSASVSVSVPPDSATTKSTVSATADVQNNATNVQVHSSTTSTNGSRSSNNVSIYSQSSTSSNISVSSTNK